MRKNFLFSTFFDTEQNYGVDDDDTDDTDEAGRYAHNHANNVLQLVKAKLKKADKLCEPWPRKDYNECTANNVRCLLTKLSEGEYSDHLVLDKKCSSRGDGADQAEGDGVEVYRYVYNKGKAAKSLCNRDDSEEGDICKNNVECRFLELLDVTYDQVSLANCTLSGVETTSSDSE